MNTDIPICGDCGRIASRHEPADHPFISVGGGQIGGGAIGGRSYLNGFDQDIPRPPTGSIGRIILVMALFACGVFWAALARYQGWI